MVTVALAWEAAYHQATTQVDRSVLLRAGIVLGGEDDPATARLRQLVRLRAGGPVAGGDQWVSWLSLDDLLRIILRSLDEDFEFHTTDFEQAAATALDQERPATATAA